MIYVAMVDHSAWQWPGYNSSTGQVRAPIARPDFTKAARLGVAGIKARACNGLRADPTFPVSMEAIHDAGLVAGAYQYLRPDRGSGRQNAEVFADLAMSARHQPTFLVADAEGNAEGLNVPQFVDWFGQWGERLRELTGRFVLRYSADWWWNPEAGPSHGDYDTIIASYPGGATVPPSDASRWVDWAFARRPNGPRLMQGEDHWDGWQFTSSLNAVDFGYPDNGSTSRLDGNLIRLDSWLRWTADTTLPDFPPPVVVIDPEPPEPPTPPPPGGTDMPALRRTQKVFDTRDGFGRMPAGWADWIDIQHPELDSAYLHFTVIDPRAPGWIKVWDGTAEPDVATVDYVSGVSGTGALVPVTGGRIFLKTSAEIGLIIGIQGGS